MSNPGLQRGQRVCVTGASGFVGSHVVRALLEGGHLVRATVRDPSDTEKTAHLKRLGATLPGELEIVQADLEDGGSLKGAMAECPYVAHVASSVRLTSKDAQREIIDVAVEGTRRVLNAIDAAGVARRVVVTSSIAAVVDSKKPKKYTFTEEDWNESASVLVSPYPRSKALAEKAAWKHAQSSHWDLITLNPSFVVGPLLAACHRKSSPALVVALLRGKIPLIPRVNFGAVDVRDVADAHVRALERPGVKGRHIISARGSGMDELARVLRAAYPDRKIPRFRLPNLAMRIVVMFEKRISKDTVRNLGRVRLTDHTKSTVELGITYRPIPEGILDTARSILELGLA